MASCLVSENEIYLLGGVGRHLNIYLTKINVEEMSSETYDISKVSY